MRNVAASATDVGLQREANEDSAFVGTSVFAVADGLGGHAAGEVASALAIQHLAPLDGTTWESPADASAALADALREANTLVYEAAEADPARSGMGTTLTAAAVHAGHLVLAHVGDSRAYLFRPGDGLRQLTLDQTAVGFAVREGILTAEQGERHPQRHMLLQAIGLEAEVEVEMPDPVPLAPGDRVLLCSDGLTEAASEESIGEILGRDDDPAALCQALVEAALTGGGPDNVTVVVARLEDDEER